ncbi:MAG: hypothetical protein ACUVWP_08460 [bacterium]
MLVLWRHKDSYIVFSFTIESVGIIYIDVDDNVGWNIRYRDFFRILFSG